MARGAQGLARPANHRHQRAQGRARERCGPDRAARQRQHGAASDAGGRGAYRRPAPSAARRSLARPDSEDPKQAPATDDPLGIREPHRTRPHAPHQAAYYARKFEDLHPADLADIMENISAAERQAIIAFLDEETAAGVPAELVERLTTQIREKLQPGK